MGRVKRGATCSVKGCEREAVRSLSLDKVKAAGLDVEGGRRVYLCEEHYKEYKKRTKKQRKAELWRFKALTRA